MFYEELIAKISSLRDSPARAESFERAKRAIEQSRFSFPEGGRGVFLVAGTNGKGTVCKTLEALLAASGATVGLFTSPHLMSACERIRSGGKDVSKEEFVEAYRLVEARATEYGLSHFEILTLMMCEVFFRGRVRPRVDFAVIEVGVGGRLDPTRVIPHAMSVVSRIGLDHVEILGDTLGAIAREKFAIVDPGNLVVHAPLPDREAREAAREACLRARSVVCAEAFPYRVEGEDPKWIVQTPWGEAKLAMPGRRAVENVSLALHVADAYGIEVDLRALENSHWPGRMEELSVSGHRVFLSGDHNLQGAESLAEILAHYSYDSLWLVVGIGKNKDRGAMLEAFARLPRSRLVLTSTPFRGAPVSSYGESWLSRSEFAIDEPRAALKWVLRQAKPSDLVIVTGSLYMVGDLRRELIRS